jgi:hypothetical protein
MAKKREAATFAFSDLSPATAMTLPNSPRRPPPGPGFGDADVVLKDIDATVAGDGLVDGCIDIGKQRDVGAT